MQILIGFLIATAIFGALYAVHLFRARVFHEAKASLINVFSHRFRTPLSALRWNLENAIEQLPKNTKVEIKSSLKDGYNRTLFLIETLDRLVESLEIEGGTLKIKSKEFNIKSVLEPLIDSFKERCVEHDIKFDVKIISCTLMGDEKRIIAICKSLLSNALQYTMEGGEISFCVHPKGDHVCIEVSDNGIGVPERSKRKIFNQFYRADNALFTFPDGQGLGLYFCKKVVELHGGSIKMKSKVNEGTTFNIVLPKK